LFTFRIMQEILHCNTKPAERNTAWRLFTETSNAKAIHSHSNTVACSTATDYISYILCVSKHDADDDNSMTLDAPEM
jgi:hypothetical protein